MGVVIESEVSEHPAGEAASMVKRATRVSAIFDSELVRLAGAVSLYSFLAILFIRHFYVSDPDIWWHLRTGEWIFGHRTVPLTDPFSLYGMGKPWVAYSWLFDIFMALLYRHFNLFGILLYDIAVRVALAVALFHLLRSIFSGFWRAAALCGLGLFAMADIIGPRPGMLTILFVILELDILYSARKTGDTRKLWLLPPMFALWANWHIQFVYGLFLLGVFAFEPLMNTLLRYEPREKVSAPAKQLGLVLGASVLATLVNPYGARGYSTVFLYMGQTKIFNNIVELKAMSFREPQHYVAFLLALSAAMAMGWRRDARPLWLILLSITSFLAFRSAREVWFLAVVSVCVIADGWRLENRERPKPATVRSRLAVAVWVLAVLFVMCRRYGVSNEALEMQVAGKFPEAASRYVEQHHLSGSLYNHFNWGGFLIWRLPQLLVAMDGRTNVHGEDRVIRFAEVWSGKAVWSSDPELAAAKIVIAEKNAALTSLLRLDPRFKIAHEDTEAVVFQRRSF